MDRKKIPDKIKNELLREYSHKCAICGKDEPHIHHIDENPSNNKPVNLLPLCPNCHLTDQHNPNRKIEIPKLQLFRNYKDTLILKPQFHPIYIRQLFLEEIEINEDNVDELREQSNELVKFLAEFERGAYYSRCVKNLVRQDGVAIVTASFNDYDGYENTRRLKQRNLVYRQKLVNNKNEIQSLIIELLAYQKW